MPSFPLISTNVVGVLIPKPTKFSLNLNQNRHNILSSSFSLCCSSHLLPLYSDFNSCNKRLLSHKQKSNHIISAKSNENTKHRHNNYVSSVKVSPNPGNNVKKQFGLRLRLRPRLWLLQHRLRKMSVRRLVEYCTIMLHRNSKMVTLLVRVSVVLSMLLVFLKCTSRPVSIDVPYSEFVSNIRTGSVSAVQFEDDSRYIYFNKNVETENKLKSVEDDGMGAGDSVASRRNEVGKMRRDSSAVKWKYCTRKVDRDEGFILDLLREKGTVYSSAPQSSLRLLRSLIIALITVWIPLAPMLWLLYRQFYASNSPAKRRRPSKNAVSFDDVEGVDAAKQELMEIVSCLRGSIDYKKLGAKLPRGVLLVGPPGTGKTLLARSVAGEAGVPFFSVSASEFVEMFVGRGAARVRDLFNVAKECAPSIVFIDEIDAVGGKRGRSFNDERDQTLNQLLTEMDGFESETKVIVIAATNRPEALDPALCRPGRFSRKVLVGEPDFEGRKKILAVHLRRVPLEEEAEIICNLVASLTEGLVGADLANIVNEAALLAARRGAESVAREDIMEAVERAKFGINERQANPDTLSKGLVKLFPWIANSTRKDGFQGLGYQTLS